MSDLKRRSFIATVATIPLTALLSATTDAADLPKLEETDPLAQALGYIHQSEISEQICRGCQLFQGVPEEEWGSCGIFSGKAVNSNGWCKSWIVKTV